MKTYSARIDLHPDAFSWNREELLRAIKQRKRRSIGFGEFLYYRREDDKSTTVTSTDADDIPECFKL